MTICIAAIGVDDKSKEIIVFATDHMVSIGNLGQFEKTISKFKEINSNTVAMLSGNPLIFDDLLKDCCKGKDFDIIKEKIHQNICSVKESYIQKQILDMYKIDFDYIKEVLKGQVQNKYMHNVLQSVSEASLQTNILVIGFKQNLAQISEVREIGIQDYRDIDFGCIGSGAVQAMNTLLFQRHSKSDSLAVTLYNVYKAKRNAEVAVGVGEETDIAILTEKGVTKIDGEKELVLGKNHDKVKELVQSL
jgi:hypothetical protein